MFPHFDPTVAPPPVGHARGGGTLPEAPADRYRPSEKKTAGASVFAESEHYVGKEPFFARRTAMDKSLKTKYSGIFPAFYVVPNGRSFFLTTANHGTYSFYLVKFLRRKDGKSQVFISQKKQQ